jgi:excisionase family DNA binding protein
MQTLFDEHYVSASEAAKLLRVHISTIRRWIDSGELPAHRIGERRILIKRADLAKLITPARAQQEKAGGMSRSDRLDIPRLTDKEKQQALEALERAQRDGATLLEPQGQYQGPESWELLDEARQERTRQLS